MNRWHVITGRSNRNRGDAFMLVNNQFVGVVYKNNPLGNATLLAERLAHGMNLAELRELQATCEHEWDIGEGACIDFEENGGEIEWHCVHCHKISGGHRG